VFYLNTEPRLKRNKIIFENGRSSETRSVAPAGASVHRLSPAAGGLLAPAGAPGDYTRQNNDVIGCNNCLMNIPT